MERDPADQPPMSDATTSDALPLPRAASPATLRDVPWKLTDVLIGLTIPAAYLAAVLLPREVLHLVPRALLWLAFVVLWVWLLAYPLWLASRGCPGFWPRLPSRRELIVEAAWMLPLIFGLWAVLAMVLFLWSLVSPSQPRDVMGEAARAGPSAGLIFVLIGSCTFGPVAEEVFFRGFLYNSLRRYATPLVAATVQASVFALLHPYNAGYVFATFFIGLYLVAVYEWRKTLLAPILLHQLQNALGAVVTVVSLFLFAQAPVLGIRGEADAQGLRVTSVVPGSGAEKAGIMLGDVVTAVDGQLVTEIRDIAWILVGRTVGDVVQIDLLRDGQALAVDAELGPRPER